MGDRETTDCVVCGRVAVCVWIFDGFFGVPGGGYWACFECSGSAEQTLRDRIHSASEDRNQYMRRRRLDR